MVEVYPWIIEFYIIYGFPDNGIGLILMSATIKITVRRVANYSDKESQNSQDIINFSDPWNFVLF